MVALLKGLSLIVVLVTLSSWCLQRLELVYNGTLLAGGGTKRGIVHGETDEIGYRVVDGKVHIHDLQATILYLLGLDHERLTYRHAGRDIRLTDVYGRIVKEVLA